MNHAFSRRALLAGGAAFAAGGNPADLAAASRFAGISIDADRIVITSDVFTLRSAGKWDVKLDPSGYVAGVR